MHMHTFIDEYGFFPGHLVFTKVQICMYECMYVRIGSSRSTSCLFAYITLVTGDEAMGN